MACTKKRSPFIKIAQKNSVNML